MRVFCIAIEPVAVIVHYIERNDQSDCKKKSINRRKLLQLGANYLPFFSPMEIETEGECSLLVLLCCMTTIKVLCELFAASVCCVEDTVYLRLPHSEATH